MSRPEELLQRFTKLRTSTLSAGVRAPHKYLLLLFAIGQCLKGEDRMIPYQDVVNSLSPLLERYAPYAKILKPEYPFWLLQNDGIWELDTAVDDDLPKNTVPPKGKLTKMHGGLTQQNYDLFSKNPDIALFVIEEILHLLYPRSLHEQILQTAGIKADINSHSIINTDEEWYRRRWRDPKFPKEVINAYKGQCAVCRFSIHMGGKPIGLEAAHIKWHQYDGPAKVSNGLALCAIHHTLFDFGAFTITPDIYKVCVSTLVSGQGDDEILGRYDSTALCVLPSEKNNHPNAEYLNWHIENVYHGDSASLR